MLCARSKRIATGCWATAAQQLDRRPRAAWSPPKPSLIGLKPEIRQHALAGYAPACSPVLTIATIRRAITSCTTAGWPLSCSVR